MLEISSNTVFFKFLAFNTTTCRDELPEDWQPNKEYAESVRCGLLSCSNFAGTDTCSMDFSLKPLSNCVSNTTGILADFCQLSCKNCGE